MYVAFHGEGLVDTGVGVHHPPTGVEHGSVGSNHAIVVASGFDERAFVIVDISHFAVDGERKFAASVVVTLTLYGDSVVARLDAPLTVAECIVGVEHEFVVAVGQHKLRMDERAVHAVLAYVIRLDFGIGDAALQDVEAGGETAVIESHSGHGNHSLAYIGVVGPL